MSMSRRQAAERYEHPLSLGPPLAVPSRAPPARQREAPRGRAPAREAMTLTIRVVLVDDQALVRTGFRMILAEADDIEVAGEAGDGDEAAQVAAAVAPDVVLMDIRMPGTDGIAATRRIRSEAGDAATPRVLILTTFDLDEYVFAGLRAGASGFLLKDALAPDLLSAVRVVASGEAVVAPTVTRRLIERFIGHDPAGDQPDRHGPGDLDVLTGREREVLALI